MGKGSLLMVLGENPFWGEDALMPNKSHNLRIKASFLLSVEVEGKDTQHSTSQTWEKAS